MTKNPVLYKVLVVGVIILFIDMSIVSSTSNIESEIPLDTQSINSDDGFDELLFRRNYGYAYNAYPGPEETFYFPLDNPYDYNYCGDTISGDFLYGGTIDCNGIWYASQYGNGLLYGIDTNNGCDMWSISGGGSGMTELAWDDETALLYIIDGYNLYWYDPETGEGDYLGNIDVSITQIEFDNNDILYGFEIFTTNDVYTINLTTFETTLVGTLSNITSYWGLCIAFDKDTNDLYLLGNGHLYICDTETYKCTLIGENLSSGVEGFSFVIPYGNDDTSPPDTTIEFHGTKGENDWFISNVFINLTATDDLSGVNTTFYRINNGDWEIYTNTFIIDYDGVHIIEFYSVDNAGNTEEVQLAEFKIDQELFIDVLVKRIGLNKWKFIATCFDYISGMDRVEFLVDEELIFTDYEKPYEWVWNGTTIPCNWSVFAFDKAGNKNGPIYTTPYTIFGFILNPQFSEYSVTFFAIILWDDLWSSGNEVIKFQYYTLNTIGCTGHIGKFLIYASYRYKWLPD